MKRFLYLALSEDTHQPSTIRLCFFIVILTDCAIALACTAALITHQLTDLPTNLLTIMATLTSVLGGLKVYQYTKE